MDLSDLIGSQSILPAVKATSKRQAIQELAGKGKELTGRKEREIFDVLMERERLGSTGIGSGIAIPHGKIAGLDGIYGAFARLSRPVDFDAIDNQPVDLMFLLLAPEDSGADHLKALARIARIVRENGVPERLREASDATSLHRILSEGATPSAA